ncbi:MAG: hypothetical protein AB1405_09215 [Bdellovibrionota bacterium]
MEEPYEELNEGLDAEGFEEAGAAVEAPRSLVPPGTREVSSSPAPVAGRSPAPSPVGDDESGEFPTIEKLLEELTGGDLTRAKLYVIKRTPGKAPVKLPPLQIEEHMRGMEVSEILGESYGDGFYRWKVRVDGKFRRSGQESIAGYSDIPNNELPIVPELDEKESDSQQVNLGEIVQHTAQAVMVPVAKVLEGVQQSLAALSASIETQRQVQQQLGTLAQPQARGSEELLLKFLTQQSQQSQALLSSLMQAVVTGTKQPRPAAAAPQGPSLTDQLEGIAKVLASLREMGLAASPATAPAFPYETGDDDDDVGEGETLALGPLPLEQSAEASRPSFLERLGEQLSGSLERVVGNVLRGAEEGISADALGDLLSGASSQPKGAALPAGPQEGATAGTDFKAFEKLFETVDQCVRNAVTMEEFAGHILPRIPDELAAILRAGQLSAADVGHLSRFLGNPKITARVQEPDFQAYLSQVLELAKGKGE